MHAYFDGDKRTTDAKEMSAWSVDERVLVEKSIL
jgi:hypothetical protein